jgi:hypothetical protein
MYINSRIIQTNQKIFFPFFSFFLLIGMVCIDMPILEYNNLSNSDEDWYCRTCTLPNFSNSYFDHNKSFDGTNDHEISYSGSLSNININIDTRELIHHH